MTQGTIAISMLGIAVIGVVGWFAYTTQNLPLMIGVLLAAFVLRLWATQA